MDNLIYIQGFKVNLGSFNDAIEFAKNAINDRKNIHIVTINPEIIQSAKKRSDLAKIINGAELVTPDGVGIIYAMKFKGVKQEQISGVNFSRKMLEVCNKEGYKVALVGAKKEVMLLAKEEIEKTCQGINIVYSHDGYFDNFEEIRNELAQSGAQFIMCAMGSPKQEYFISYLKQKLEGAVMIGVGGTFDVLSGTVEESPEIFRKLGLEWLFRAIKQPQRFKRIFPTLPIFFFQSIIEGIQDKYKKRS